MTTLDGCDQLQIYCGTDTENNMSGSQIMKTVQMCFPRDVFDRVIVFHLGAMGVFNHVAFPKELRRLLQHEKLVHCGVNIGFDHDKLQHFCVKLKSMMELIDLARQHDATHTSYSMSALVERYVGLHVDKSCREANWDQKPLPNPLKQYAALDVARALH